MIIDSHVHVDEVTSLGWFDPPEAILPLMDEAGIEKAIIMTYTDAPVLNEQALEYIAEVLVKHKPRFYGYARIHPGYPQAVEMLERAVKEYGFHGLKLHPVSNISHPADSQSHRLIQKAAELGVPTLYHCGDEPMATPFELEYAAKACPQAKIIFAHIGGYFHAAEAIEVAARNPNVYLDTSAQPDPRWIKKAVDRLGAEKVLFGSDGPGCDPKLEVYKVKRAGLTPEQEKLLFSGNILRLLGARA